MKAFGIALLLMALVGLGLWAINEADVFGYHLRPNTEQQAFCDARHDEVHDLAFSAGAARRFDMDWACIEIWNTYKDYGIS